ncbi:MAG: hypothetical protein C0410_07705 [Anaerolinea sp.]|nr:hypothetical protein [Anaerolinea sp.]
MSRYSVNYLKNVFINCPFDNEYAHLLKAIVFTIHDIGFRPRCAREASNAGQIRLEKILEIISECKYSIHDISRTELDITSGLPRFNMPLELGLDLGCKQFGKPYQQEKVSLILDIESYRYQKFISDIAGQDIFGHDNNEENLVLIVRNWLSLEVDPRYIVPGGEMIFRRYQVFQGALPDICNKLHWNPTTLPFNDFSYAVAFWISSNPI